MFFLVWIKHACMFDVISFFGHSFLSESRILKESLIITIYYGSGHLSNEHIFNNKK